MMRFIIILLSLFSFCIPELRAQADAESLVRSLAKKIQLVDNYSVDVLVKIDVEFINIEERRAKVFFEKPDKFEIKSTGILLLPKKGLEMGYLELFNNEFTALDEKKETINGIPTRLIKLIPMGSELDIVLAQFWIDEQNLRIVRMKTYTKSSGSYLIDFAYTNIPFDLPAGMTIEFDVKSMALPSTLSGDFENLSKSLEKKGVSKGTVIIEYSNYIVNKGGKVNK
jgi:hypothetical protein